MQHVHYNKPFIDKELKSFYFNLYLPFVVSNFIILCSDKQLDYVKQLDDGKQFDDGKQLDSIKQLDDAK